MTTASPPWDPTKLEPSDTPQPSAALGFAYLLWFFGGLFGLHRFYLGRIGSAVAMFVLTITVVGLLVSAIWWLVDVFLISGIYVEVTGHTL